MLTEQVGERIVLGRIFGENAFGAIILFVDDATHFGIDASTGLFRVGFLETFLIGVVGHVGQALAHAEIGHHAVSTLRDAFQIVERTARNASEEDLFGCATGQGGADFIEHLFLGRDGTLLGQVPRRAERLAAGHNGDFDERVGVLEQPRHRGVAGFVDGNGTLFFVGHDACLLLQTADDAIHRVEKILLRHGLAVVTSGDERGLVAHVGDVGPRETGRLSREQFDVQARLELQGTQMHIENGDAFGQVGQVDVDLTVETSGTQQCLVEHIDAVGGRQDDDTRIGAETVHLGQQLVERILAFVVAAETGAFGTRTSHRVNLVDEHDRGGLFFRFLEKVAHTAGTDAHKHLDKVGTRHREERNARFACHGLGQQRLTRSRRTDEEGAFGNLTAELRVFIGIFEEVYNLLHLLFRAFLSGHVLEGHLHSLIFIVFLGFAFAHAEQAAAGVAHAAEHEEPETDEQQERQERTQDVEEEIVALLIGHFAFVADRRQVIFDAIGRRIASLHSGLSADLFGTLLENRADIFGANHHADLTFALVDGDIVRIAFGNILFQFRVAHVLRGASGIGSAAPEHDRHHSDDGKIQPREVEFGHLRFLGRLGS